MREKISLKTLAHFVTNLQKLTPREAIASKKYWPYKYKLSHMASRIGNTYEMTNNIGIITDQTHSQMRRLELA